MGTCIAAPNYSTRVNSHQSLLVKITNLRKTSQIARYTPITQLIRIDESGSLMLARDNIVFGPHETCFEERVDSETEDLVKINWEDQSVEIIANKRDNDYSNLSDKCWSIVDGGLKDQGYVLNVGDVLSFGRVRFRVKSLDADMYGNLENLIHSRKFNGKGIYANSSPESKSSSEKLAVEDSPPSSKTSSDEKSGIEDIVCRICLDGTSNEEDPIVHICKCSGSIKNVHVKCLKRWYTDRIVAKSSRCLLSYYWEKLKCELCKEDIANEVIINGRSYSLIDIPEVRQPHIALECFMKDSSNGLHIVKFDEHKRVRTIGREPRSDIVINDASVSREQAIITYQEGVFRLHSSSSKNSTCVLIQHKKIPFYMLNGIKIKLRGFIFEINTTEYNMKHLKTQRSYP